MTLFETLLLDTLLIITHRYTLFDCLGLESNHIYIHNYRKFYKFKCPTRLRYRSYLVYNNDDDDDELFFIMHRYKAMTLHVSERTMSYIYVL